MASIQFLGAAGTVTGSKFLIEHDGKRILVDCGLFQGSRQLRERNWAPPPVPPESIDLVVLTHAHIDHIGGLPRLVKSGYSGEVLCTAGTRDLAGLLLPDSAYLQEEEARYANKEKYSKHSPALPLYTVEDAARTLKLLTSIAFDRTRQVLPGITVRFERAGHILGSAIVTFELASTGQRLVFTGDLGRYDAPILRNPSEVLQATWLVAESTYGDREHGPERPMDALAEVVNTAVAKGGMIVIPAFAIGRTQEMLYHLRNLEEERRIPELDVWVDSPMACNATPIYLAHAEEHDVDMQAITNRGGRGLATARTHFCRSVGDSKKLNSVKGPGIIISASGMATGGRILHHLKLRLPDPKNTVLFVGYQSEGTRGRRLLDGEKVVRIHGGLVPVNAAIKAVSGFSAHADWHEMLRWMDGFRTAPRQTVLVHGEPSGLAALKARVEAKGWPAYVPSHLEKLELR